MLYNLLQELLGLDAAQLQAHQMIMRSLIIYVIGIILIRFHRRFVGEQGAFDIVVRFIAGSALANTITGNSPFVPTVSAVVFLVFLDWFTAVITFYSPWMESLLKGSHEILFKNNTFNWKVLRKHFISKDEILEAARSSAGVEHFNQIDKAILETDGKISIICQDKQKKHHSVEENDEYY